MKLEKLCGVLLSCLLLGACAQAPVAPPPGLPVMRDALFAPPSQTIDPGEALALNDAMRQYLRGMGPQLRERGLRSGLIAALYSSQSLKLAYDASTTRSAADAFETRRGNCLSLVLMTAAFAKQLGLSVQYNQVVVDPAWSRLRGIDFASGHVNLTLGSRLDEQGRGYDSAGLLTVDFLPQAELQGQRARPLSEQTIVSMYLNNRAAEAMARDALDDAYWWARAAVRQDPAYTPAQNTLGVVYLRHGDLAEAEQVLRLALDRQPADASVLVNLARVLERSGRVAEARVLEERLARLGPMPPMHYVDLGLQALQRGDTAAAKRLFDQAVAAGDGAHEPHFWLAIANLKLGDAREAARQLALARDRSTSDEDRALYAAKLDRLREQTLH